jgi:hypothetical protein
MTPKKEPVMTVRKKILNDVEEFMDKKPEELNLHTDWRIQRSAFYLRQVEEEEKARAAKSNGQH